MAVADEGCADAASVGATELSRWVAGGEGASLFIAVVTTVVCVVTRVAERHTAPIVAVEVRG